TPPVPTVDMPATPAVPSTVPPTIGMPEVTPPDFNDTQREPQTMENKSGESVVMRPTLPVGPADNGPETPSNIYEAQTPRVPPTEPPADSDNAIDSTPPTDRSPQLATSDADPDAAPETDRSPDTQPSGAAPSGN